MISVEFAWLLRVAMATPEKLEQQNLFCKRRSATLNCHLTNKNASLAFGDRWRVLSEKTENSSWLQILNKARTKFENDDWSGSARQRSWRCKPTTFSALFLRFWRGWFLENCIWKGGWFAYCLAKAIQAEPRSAKPRRAHERPKSSYLADRSLAEKSSSILIIKARSNLSTVMYVL